ncbi:hypothetical protein [Pleionea litopenaei]|uniref:Uncharacterized protein n=1 Tax=Pleionea litopenaei TaxID=3070815 RepID=A0AA51RVD4_9GAMM|nr:hypothetical protein [Pleionea sp. HL-JVS1]WMS88353.1 hypothetical protein Q9312_05390 [Pleionea sp. HL-JVS1]
MKNSLLITGGTGLGIVSALNAASMLSNNPNAVFFSEAWFETWFAVYITFLALSFAGIGMLLSKRKTVVEKGAPPMEPKMKAYTQRMVVAIILYVAAIIASHFLLKMTNSLLMQSLITLLPITPCFMMLRAIRLFVKEMDELQLRIFMESCLFALTWTAMACITVGFFQFYGVIPTFSIFWVFSGICMLFGIGSLFAHRRYQ